MLYDESTASSLRPWLVRTLQPICDADPEALADYVLALLKHDAAEPELRKMFVSQLEEFLEKGTASPRLGIVAAKILNIANDLATEASKFVDSLFSALRSKSYLPYEPIKDVPDGGIPIPLDALMSSAGPSDRVPKRSLEVDDHDHPPPKGPRLSNDGHFSRYHGQSRGNTDIRGGHMNGRGMGRGEGPSLNGHMRPMGIDVHHSSAMYRPPGGGFNGRGRRGICRDYHNNGFCARGSLCQYSHGEDAVIPPMPYPNGPGIVNPMQAAPFMPMFGSPPFGGIPGAAYDPHESHMEMGPRQPRGQRVPESRGMHDPIPVSSVELPVIQDLTPRDPVDEATRGDGAIQPNGFTHNFGTPRRAPQPPVMVPMGNSPIPFGGGVGGHIGGGVGNHVGGHLSGGVGGHIGGGGVGGHMGAGGGFRRSGRGTFTGDNHSFRNGTPRDDKTLVVEKIPDDKLTLEAVNGWFKRFGTVTNVAIDSPSAKALVSFSNHSEAHSAWKSEEAVFSNRFVKLYWHRPLEGHGVIGQRALAASGPLVRNIGATNSPSQTQPEPQSQSQPQPSGELQPQPLVTRHPKSPTQPSVSSTPIKQPQKPDPGTVAALAARQQLLEKQISEQKVLMSRLTTASTSEEKQEIIARIKLIQSGTIPPSPVSTGPSTSKLSNGSSKVLSEKERLDKELEMHSVQSALKGGSENDDQANSTSALKEKLERLKAEASRLGVPESEINADSSINSYLSYRPYRGRGFRARGFGRGSPGRGGPPRSSMKLDNRPRKLIIRGLPANDEAVQRIRNHYQNMGNLESFWSEGEGEVVAQFWSRTAAEYALTTAPDIPSGDKLQIDWHTGTAPPQTPAVATTSVVQSEPSNGKAKCDTETKMEVEAPQGEHEDGGWGQAYDDEDEGRRRRSRSRSFS